MSKVFSEWLKLLNQDFFQFLEFSSYPNFIYSNYLLKFHSPLSYFKIRREYVICEEKIISASKILDKGFYIYKISNKLDEFISLRDFLKKGEFNQCSFTFARNNTGEVRFRWSFSKIDKFFITEKIEKREQEQSLLMSRNALLNELNNFLKKVEGISFQFLNVIVEPKRVNFVVSYKKKETYPDILLYEFSEFVKDGKAKDRVWKKMEKVLNYAYFRAFDIHIEALFLDRVLYFKKDIYHMRRNDEI